MSKTRQRQIRSLAANYSSGYRIEWHSHDWHQLLFATSGVIYLTTPENHWIVPPFRAIWIPSGLQHEARMAGVVAMRTLFFDSRTRVCGNQCAAFNVPDIMRELIVHTCQAGIVKEDSTENRALIQLVICLARKMDVAPLRLPMPREQRALQVATHILENPTQELDLVAKNFGMGMRTVQRLFKQQTGLALGRWRRQARLLSSLEKLEQGRSVTDVAFDVGFESVSAFISVFRNFFGVTPAKYF